MKSSLFSTFPRKSTHDQTKINPWNIRKLYVVAVWKGLNFAVVKNKYSIKKTLYIQLVFNCIFWNTFDVNVNPPKTIPIFQRCVNVLAKIGPLMIKVIRCLWKLCLKFKWIWDYPQVHLSFKCTRL